MGIYEQSLKVLRDYIDSDHGGIKRTASEALNLTDPSVLGQWLTGKKSPRLDKIGPALDIIGAKLLPPDADLKEYALVPKRAARPGAGSSLETSAEVEGLFAFRKDWLSKLNIPNKNIELFDVVGDSMEPTLREGDTLLVDKNDTEIMDGKIYVVSLHDELLAKRVQRILDGFALLSDNKAYDPIPVKPELRDKFRIHGRVRWFGREL